MARLRACMLVWALKEAMCTRWRMRNSRVLQRGAPGVRVTQGSQGRSKAGAWVLGEKGHVKAPGGGSLGGVGEPGLG